MHVTQANQKVGSLPTSSCIFFYCFQTHVWLRWVRSRYKKSSSEKYSVLHNTSTHQWTTCIARWTTTLQAIMNNSLTHRQIVSVVEGIILSCKPFYFALWEISSPQLLNPPRSDSYIMFSTSVSQPLEVEEGVPKN